MFFVMWDRKLNKQNPATFGLNTSGVCFHPHTLDYFKITASANHALFHIGRFSVPFGTENVILSKLS